jgi:hypothetical protein
LIRSAVLALSVASAGTGYLYALAHEGRSTTHLMRKAD